MVDFLLTIGVTIAGCGIVYYFSEIRTEKYMKNISRPIQKAFFNSLDKQHEICDMMESPNYVYKRTIYDDIMDGKFTYKQNRARRILVNKGKMTVVDFLKPISEWSQADKDRFLIQG